MSSSDTNPVRHRHVFYIPGYDPFHPRRYRELYRRESVKQAEITGYEIAQHAKIGAKKSDARFGWHVEAKIDGQETQADFEVLVWTDIVRDSMKQGILGTYLLLLRTAWTYIASGAIFRLMRLRKGPVIAALYPVGFLLLQLVLAGLAFWIIASLSGIALGHVENIFYDNQIFTPMFYPIIILSLLAGVAAAYAVMQWFKVNDNRFYAYYLMHDYAYSARNNGANPPALEARLGEFTDALSDALKGDVDEVLVVGHSSGAHMAVTVLADLIRKGQAPEHGPALAFLSLGQVVPMVSFLRDAGDLRRDLAYLSTRDELTWIDVSAPGDGGSFALCDPVAVSGVAPTGKRWPLVFSAAFTQSLSSELWKSMRWRFFRTHFQYLCAFDRPKDYDYFQITAGPLTLSTRYEGRPASKSRIETPRSGYTDMSP